MSGAPARCANPPLKTLIFNFENIQRISPASKSKILNVGDITSETSDIRGGNFFWGWCTQNRSHLTFFFNLTLNFF